MQRVFSMLGFCGVVAIEQPLSAVDRQPLLLRAGAQVNVADDGGVTPLALACQYGFIAVPSFRDRYRGHADEAAASQLCGRAKGALPVARFT